ncbi:CoA transferase [Plastorhodobacter daqingensis]|uniref:CoA transferase n=1 Tax=Plastorhodobacter daqingensis TaxID=1387281 RepID=A0ABW2UK47_9RHOB
MNMLQGIRVLELADGLVDFGGRMLAELGADVVSVADAAPRSHARTLAWHHGKTRLELDDPQAIARLAAMADIILDGRREGDRLTSAEIPESCIHICVQAFPHAPDRRVTDLTLMAMSGLMAITGDPDHPPLRFPGEQAYALTGIQAATAALLALHARRRDGKGQRAVVSALQSATLANYREAVMYEWTGRIGRRTGNMLVRGASGVRQIWPCRDGHVTWSMIDNPGMMRALVRVMDDAGEAGELATVNWDATLVADTPQEVIDRWQRIVADFFAVRGKSELEDLSLRLGWGLSPISDPQEVRESLHLQARGLFVQVMDEVTGQEAALPGPLFRAQAEGAPPRRLARPVPASAFTGWDGA